MRWKQFFTPVKAFTSSEAKAFMQGKDIAQYTLLDVRQPGEYESEHIPGAKLIPLPDLNDRLGEIDPHKPTIVYCAVGGRSRVAAQMLAGKGFDEVINLTGGIKAWKNEKALGGEEQGLALFSGKESPEEALVIAYSLEAGLRDFYLAMAPKVQREAARKLFEKLATIEVKHQQRIYGAYIALTDTPMSEEEFASRKVVPAMEGGLTTEEYMAIYQPDINVVEEVISLAMAIEAQALDLYQRAARRAEMAASQALLHQIASEERSHLEQLGKLIG